MGGVLGADPLQGLGNGALEIFGGAGLGGPQEGFDLAPHHLDGIEIRRVGWQEADFRPGLGDERQSAVVFVSAEIVHDDDIAHAQ